MIRSRTNASPVPGTLAPNLGRTPILRNRLPPAECSGDALRPALDAERPYCITTRSVVTSNLPSHQPLDHPPPNCRNRIIPRPIRMIAIIGQGGGAGEDRGVKEVNDDRPVLTGTGPDFRVVAVNLITHA